jgi:hypothetical protein
MAARKKSPVDEARQKVQRLEAQQERVSALDSRTDPDRGDPWRETAFLAAVMVLMFVLCLVVMLLVGRS